jgi:hypothetical protein
MIENEFPDKTFIYATHNINFALRQNVDKVYVLSSQSENISYFTGLDSLPRSEVVAFLGGLPGIVSTNHVVVTEGHEKSFDAIFYRWLLSDSRLEIYPAGGCTDVVGVVARSGLWAKISTNVSICGAVDSDYRDGSYLQGLAGTAVTVLPLHEAESYLCLPAVIASVAAKIGSQESTLSLEEVESLIMHALRRPQLPIAARRVFAKARMTLAVSLERKVLAKASSRDDLVNELRAASTTELTKATNTLGAAQIEHLVDAELAAIDAAIQSTDVLRALQLLPAKELLNSLAPRAGCKNGTDLMRSLKNNFQPADFPQIAELRASLLSHRIP